ncbi:hypothetical protein BVX99_02020 [bacterium F16]|nr:hypothetical protein BVX99_02020 [bacterium F16]
MKDSLIFILSMLFINVYAQSDSKEKNITIDVNDHLGILVQKIDLQSKRIEIHVCNISEFPFKVSHNKAHFEGRVVIKTENKAMVFTHKEYNRMRETGTWINPIESLGTNGVIKYEHSLKDFVDPNEKTDLERYLFSLNEKEIHVKLLTSNIGVLPFAVKKNFSKQKALQGNWQKVSLTINK